MDRGNEPAIAGIWLLGETDRRLAENAGRLLFDGCTPPSRSEPAFESRGWAATAKLGNHVLVGDLRIDNAGELGAELGIGNSRQIDPPTLLLHAWERWQDDVFSKLDGDFAVALWDGNKRQLILARDLIGQRPLHYRSFEGAIAFASTALPLACLEGEVEPDLERLASFLAFVPDPGPRTFLKHVERVIPGHVLIADSAGRIEQRRWWRTKLNSLPLSPARAVERMRAEVERAVSASLSTDAPVVAAQLSGGHDSSLVVATASALMPSGKTLAAITGEGDGEKTELPPGAFDEAEVAVETAAMLSNVEHLLARAAPESPLKAIDRWATSGEAMLNPYNLGWLDRTFAIAREAGADVMLVGVSGNLTVSHWGVDRLTMLAKGLKFRSLLREIASYRRNYGGSWPGLLGITFGPWMPERLWLWLAALRGRTPDRFDERAFLRPSAPQVRSALKRGRKAGLPVSGAPPRLVGSPMRLAELLWADPGPMNHFVRATHGIELRDPLAARRVVELSLQLGPEHFYRDGKGRRLSRALLEGQVPERVTSENRRGMQGVNWLASARLAEEEMKRELERLASDPQLSALFDVEKLRQRLDRWPRNGWADAEQNEVYRGFLTTAIAAARWARLMRERDCGAPAQ